MLYNPDWQTKTKPDVFSLESLIAWLETQSADGTYDYEDCTGLCLYGLYAASHGISWTASGGAGRYGAGANAKRSLFCDLVYDKVANPKPWIFGAALARARAALLSVSTSELTK